MAEEVRKSDMQKRGDEEVECKMNDSIGREVPIRVDDN